MNEIIEKIADRIADGESFKTILNDAELKLSCPNAAIIDDCLVLDPSIIYADDGNAEVEFEDVSHKEAANQYVYDGDWGEIDKTFWVDVTTYRKGIDATGNYVNCDIDSHTISRNPEEPDCAFEIEHEWVSPHEILGGLEENPGVWGHGAGTVCKSICKHCGEYMITDSWAQNPATGEQGLYSIEYQPADNDSIEWVIKQLLDNAETQLDNDPNILEYKSCDNHIIASISNCTNFDDAVSHISSYLGDRFDVRIYDETRTLEIYTEDWD